MIRKRGNAYQADVTLDGKRRRRQFATWDEAKAWEDSQMTSGGLSDSGGCAGSTGLRAVSSRLIPTLLGDTDHAVNVQRHLDEAIGVIGDIPVSMFDDTHVEKLLAHYRKIGNSNGTINRKWASLSKLFRHLYRTRIIQHMSYFPRQKEPQGRIRFLSREEEEAMFRWLEQFNEDEYRLALFLVDTGARFGEAVKLETRDVDLKNKCVTFWETKSNHSRTVFLTSRAMKSLNIPASGTRPFGMINRWTFRDHWAKARELAGLGNDPLVVPHILRHTCASRLVQGGTDLRRVQEWMGHRSMQMTMRYAHLAPRDLKTCVDVLEADVVER